MRIIEFNIITGEETIVETSDVAQIVITEEVLPIEEVVADLTQLLVDKGVIY